MDLVEVSVDVGAVEQRLSDITDRRFRSDEGQDTKNWYELRRDYWYEVIDLARVNPRLAMELYENYLLDDLRAGVERMEDVFIYRRDWAGKGLFSPIGELYLHIVGVFENLESFRNDMYQELFYRGNGDFRGNREASMRFSKETFENSSIRSTLVEEITEALLKMYDYSLRGNATRTEDYGLRVSIIRWLFRVGAESGVNFSLKFCFNNITDHNSRLDSIRGSLQILLAYGYLHRDETLEPLLVLANKRMFRGLSVESARMSEDRGIVIANVFSVLYKAYSTGRLEQGRIMPLIERIYEFEHLFDNQFIESLRQEFYQES
jgi:hypothetical protein